MKLKLNYKCKNCSKIHTHNLELTTDEVARLESFGIKNLANELIEVGQKLIPHNHICESDLNNNYYELSIFEFVGVEVGEKPKNIVIAKNGAVAFGGNAKGKYNQYW